MSQHYTLLFFWIPTAIIIFGAIAVCRRFWAYSNESLVAAIMIGFLVRAYLSVFLCGSGDTVTITKAAELLSSGSDFYNGKYSYPPLYIMIIAWPVHAIEQLGLRPEIVHKALNLGADLALGIWLARRMIRENTAISWIWVAAYLLNPVAIYNAGYHGNLESVTLLICFAGFVFLQREGLRCLILGTLMLGIATAMKHWPAILLPSVLFRHPIRRTPIILLCFFAPTMISVFGYGLIIGNYGFLRQIVGYKGIVGLDGISKVALVIASAFGGSTEKVANFFAVSKLSNLALVFGLLTVAWQTRRKSLSFAWAASCVTFYALAPNLARQYLLWVIPWAIAARMRFCGIYTVVISLYLVLQPRFPNRPELFNFGGILAVSVWLCCVLWFIHF
ncbi:MAG: glycosyltransferase 87 family protein, partial [Candidatus Krumholzibacteria bacterium]|nr:glycosyltransferase 87 family protein [Candidatus Krumholzibacteria bacterium]